MNKNTSSYCLIWKTEELGFWPFGFTPASMTDTASCIGAEHAETPGNIQDDNAPREDVDIDVQGSSVHAYLSMLGQNSCRVTAVVDAHVGHYLRMPLCLPHSNSKCNDK